MTEPRSKVPVLLSVLAALVVTALPAAAQKMAVQWKYEPGSEVVYRVSNKQEMEIQAMGGTQLSEQVQTMRWRVVDGAPNGDATVTVTTERVQLDGQGLAGDVHYDSQTDAVPDNPQAKMMSAMVGSSYTMLIGANGEVKSVEGMADLREKVLGAMSAEGAAMAQTMFDQMFSDESMTRMMQQSVQLFPVEPVGPTDSWDHSFSVAVPMLGTMTTNTTYTLTEFAQREGRTVASISTTGEIVLGADSTSPMPMTIDLGSTKMTGSIDFDVDRGLTLASNMSMTMQMTVGAGGQETSMGMTQTTRVELIEYLKRR